MKKINDLFYVQYGNSLDLASLTQCKKEDKNAINFVSRTSQNNGVSAVVEKIAGVEPLPAGTLSVAVGGSVMETFLQPEEYYTGYHVLILTPKIEMTDNQKIFYCACIRANKYKYNYGRQANKTLKDILVPDTDEIPLFVSNAQLPTLKLDEPVDSIITPILDTAKWKEFKFADIFEIKKGYYNKKPEHLVQGNIPFIGASRNNNGITEFYSIDDISLYHRDGSTNYDDINKKLFQGNCITVLNNGESVAYAFYQETEFTCSHDVNPLYLKGYKMNKYIACFFITLIFKEKYRWCYGRKWRPVRMADSIIKLPVKSNGEPDFEFMERYIKSLPYSKSI